MAKRPGKTRESDASGTESLRNEPNVYSSRYRRMRSPQSMNFDFNPNAEPGDRNS